MQRSQTVKNQNAVVVTNRIIAAATKNRNHVKNRNVPNQNAKATLIRPNARSQNAQNVIILAAKAAVEERSFVTIHAHPVNVLSLR